MRLLELFCGTKSVGNIFNDYDYEVLSIDILEKFKPDVVTDILDWDFKQYPPQYFDVIWASPPCNTFSALRNCLKNSRAKWTQEKIDSDILNIGLPILRRTEEIIDYFQPKYWFIENPQTGKMKNYIERTFFDVDYCQYGYDYRKRTRIWSNLELDVTKCNHKRHVSSIGRLGTQKTTLAQRYSIPSLLIKSIIEKIISMGTI